jgi:predicted MFS family arabinose efflux permease
VSAATVERQRHTAHRAVVPVVALCCGVTVANIYIAHPILTLLGAEFFRFGDGNPGLIVTLAQIAYAAGLFFLVPLGDVVRRKRLLTVLVTGASVALVVAGFALNLPMLAVATVVLSAMTVAPHVLIPFVVSIVPRERQGRALAAISAGMTGGIVLSRVVDGAIGDWLGWSAVYFVAAALTIGVGVTTALILPTEAPRTALPYPKLLASMLRLLRDEPVVRWAVAIQIPVFGTFNFIWVMIVFLLTERYGMSVATAGLFGLFSLVTMASAPLVGRMLDRFGSRPVMAVSLSVLMLGAFVMLASEVHLGFVVCGVVLLNLGQQGTQIGNQSRVLNLLPEARSRLNTLYMTSNFIGGAAASLAAAFVFEVFGWFGVVAGALTTSVIATVLFLLERLRAR